MELVIDGRTMAVRWPSGVPVTDVSLVLGDTVPVRIRVDHALTDCTPALAVKQTIGSADLVMTVTAFTRQDDWQEASWVVNTVPLQEALDSADRVELVGEVVLVAPDGAQHTSRPIRVTVRRDILPADYAPPVEVLADWSDLVATALAAQLPAALKDAGVELEAATGQSTLSSGDAADTWTIVGGYAMTWGDEILAGHLPDSCRLTSISTVYFFTDPALNQYCLRIWRLTDGAYSLIGTSAYVSNLSSGQTATWVFTPGVPLTRGDVIIIQVCEGTEMTPYALGMHHLLYRPEFIDSLIVYDISFANNYIEKPLLLRASYDCKLVHRALAPHSKGTYSSKGSGKRELLVVAENGGTVNLYVNDEKNGIHVSDTSPQGKAAAWVCWEMDSFGIYTITVENTSDKEISFVITSN